jgi:hypothetical protein
LGFDEISALSSNILTIAKRLDEEIAIKYDIERKCYSDWTEIYNRKIKSKNI